MKRSTFITTDQLKVGMLILVALGIITVAIFKLGEAANLFSKRYQLVAFLPNANGIVQGGQVTIAGQIAGSIRKIEFLPPDADTTRNLKVTLDIDADLKEQVRADSKGRLRTMGLLGDKVFDISPGTPRYAILTPGDTIAMGQSLDLEQVIQQASSAVGDMVALTHDMKTITGNIVRGDGTVGQLLNNRGLYDELTATLQRTNVMIGRLENPHGTIGRMIDDPSLYENAVKMIGSVDAMVRAANNPNGTMGRLLADSTMYSHLVGIAQGGDSLLTMIRTGQGTAGKMLTDQQLYDELLKSVTDLNAILADVRAHPEKYMKGVIKVF